MKPIFLLKDQLEAPKQLIGGKGHWLAKLSANNVSLPKTAIISTDAYRTFIEHQGLGEKIGLELNRKEFSQMRWEEIWDCSLRIRNLFLQGSFPAELYSDLNHFLDENFPAVPLAVRSSAPDEDQQKSSFAGLHESILNVQRRDDFFTSLKKVWASLWSDRALLYRQELSLSITDSSMAIVLQELVEAEISGICFTHDPQDEERMIIEAVHGLNQGLVDGDIEPDRWTLERSSLKDLNHIAPQAREKSSSARNGSISLVNLPPEKAEVPPLSGEQVLFICREMKKIEELFTTPLDIEWCLHQGNLIFLQSRPITARNTTNKGDERSWYLSLHRSFDNLQQLRHKIEKEMLPQITNEAHSYSTIHLDQLSDKELAEQIRERQERCSHWSKIYWRDCIPFAHGIRLFGEIYNDLMEPSDPHEFVSLLTGQEMLSIQRNNKILSLARKVKKDESLRDLLKTGKISRDASGSFGRDFFNLLDQYGAHITSLAGQSGNREELLARVILQYSEMESLTTPGQSDQNSMLRDRFIQTISEENHAFNGEELLELAQASYRIRDDDNIYLGKLEEQANHAFVEGKKRLGASEKENQAATPEEVADLLRGAEPSVNQATTSPAEKKDPIQKEFARQLIGQPASRGVARGIARVVKNGEELIDFEPGEILIIESIDPNMTFFAPLAKGIVEQRGGMLIHGAIIAREYGIPCVTGVPQATRHIKTGEEVTVDGYLGIVTIERSLSQKRVHSHRTPQEVN